MTAARDGAGLLTDTFRLGIRYANEGAGPPTLVAKMPSQDAVAAHTAARLNAYQRECPFQRESAPR
ncbi:hypothetical protein AB0L10_45215, partial [Streptomyces flaveolus]|uniref:hypothetical protein n=1 Tax=Streptomyces flaveolus TaxID=67297 RepID=UPI00341FCC2E